MIRLVLALFLALFPAAALAETPPPAPSRFSVVVEGQGPDVILIPGLSSPRDVWDGTRAALRGRYRLHLVQLRGFGEPAGPNAEGPVLEPFVEELAAYIRDNHLSHPAIIGHSLGGLSALMLGARHPELPGRIMVVDAVPFIGILFDPNATVASITPLAAQMRDAILAQAATVRPEFDRPVPDCSAPGADPGSGAMLSRMSNSPAGRCLVAHWSRRADLRVVGRAMYDDTITDMTPELGRIAAPLTLLYPQDDGVATPEAARTLYANAYRGTPHLTLVAVPGSFHFIMLDQPERFRTALEAFLAARNDH
jgi:pimeloyl-ACP methyl ester carboxylesterase